MIQVGSEDEKNGTLNTIFNFIESMDLTRLVVVTLSDEALKIWKSEEQFQAQDDMGRDVITRFARPEVSSLVLVDQKNRPVLLMSRPSPEKGWEGLSIDPRLRQSTRDALFKNVRGNQSF